MQNPHTDGLGIQATYNSHNSVIDDESSSTASRVTYTTSTSRAADFFFNTSSSSGVDLFNNNTNTSTTNLTDTEFGGNNITGNFSSLDVVDDDLIVDDSVQYIPNNHFVLMVMGMAALFFLLAVLCVLLRDYCWKKYGIDICCGNGPKDHNANASSATPWSVDYYGVNYYAHLQTMSARRAALLEELQNLGMQGGVGGEITSPQSEEEREEALAKRREARKIWYEEYLKPYTIVRYTVQSILLGCCFFVSFTCWLCICTAIFLL